MYDNSNLVEQTDLDVKFKADGSIDVDYYLTKAKAERSAFIVDAIRSLFVSKDKQEEKVTLGSFARERIQVLGYQKMTLEF
ncbi:MAG: hypothetical protein OQK12_06940 [Motiliproteus sp.]|nr:hypothetical protein [Motiliproteus sp.]MCW9051724.1 hypothetical protein [Motiliproteus sp.]